MQSKKINSKHPFLLISHELAELCRPLEMLGIHHFTYQKHFLDGSRINLSNKPQWIEDYYQLNLYKSSSYEKAPQYYEEGFKVFIGDYPLEVYQHGRRYYNTAHSLIVTEQQDDGCEFYFFATTPDNERVIHQLANNIEVIYHFILYIKDRGSRLFDKANKNKAMLEFNQNENNEITYIEDSRELQRIKNHFFRATHIYKYQFEKGKHRGVSLTNREIDCIGHMLNNKTAEETASIMGISRRTVESYFDNIKLKLLCNNKAEITEKLINNKYIKAIRSSWESK